MPCCGSELVATTALLVLVATPALSRGRRIEVPPCGKAGAFVAWPFVTVFTHHSLVVTGVLVSTIVPGGPKVISVVAQVDMTAVFTNYSTPLSPSPFTAPQAPPMISPTALLPKGPSVPSTTTPNLTVRACIGFVPSGAWVSHGSVHSTHSLRARRT